MCIKNVALIVFSFFFISFLCLGLFTTNMVVRQEREWAAAPWCPGRRRNFVTEKTPGLCEIPARPIYISVSALSNCAYAYATAETIATAMCEAIVCLFHQDEPYADTRSRHLRADQFGSAENSLSGFPNRKFQIHPAVVPAYYCQVGSSGKNQHKIQFCFNRTSLFSLFQQKIQLSSLFSKHFYSVCSNRKI